MTIADFLQQSDIVLYDSPISLSRASHHYVAIQPGEYRAEQHLLCNPETLFETEQNVITRIIDQAAALQLTPQDILLENTPLVPSTTVNEDGEPVTTGDQGSSVPDVRQAFKHQDDYWFEMSSPKPESIVE
jgi:hypothetical protein